MKETTIKGYYLGKDLKIIDVKTPIIPESEFSKERLLILTGKRKKPDLLSWSGISEIDGTGDYIVSCTGLFKGRYGDSKVKASELYRFMFDNAPRSAFSFMCAWSAWCTEGANQ